MLIICPNCSATYRIELSTLGAKGRNVRCARCKEVWMASAMDAVTADFRPDPAPPETPAIPADPRPPESAPEPEDAEAMMRALSESATPDGPLLAAPAAASPSIIPGFDPVDFDAAASAHAEPVTDIEAAAERRERRARLLRQPERKRRRWPISGLATAILVMTGAVGLLLNFRLEIVRAAPQTASLYALIGMPVNLRGLTFENVKLTRENTDGITVVGIEGLIVNTMDRPVRVPRLRFSVRNATGHELYAWTSLPAVEVIQPTEALAFNSRLASPPAEGREILIRFFTRRDAIGGLPAGQESISDGAGKSRGTP